MAKWKCSVFEKKTSWKTPPGEASALKARQLTPVSQWSCLTVNLQGKEVSGVEVPVNPVEQQPLYHITCGSTKNKPADETSEELPMAPLSWYGARGGGFPSVILSEPHAEHTFPAQQSVCFPPPLPCHSHAASSWRQTPRRDTGALLLPCCSCAMWRSKRAAKWINDTLWEHPHFRRSARTWGSQSFFSTTSVVAFSGLW